MRVTVKPFVSYEDFLILKEFLEIWRNSNKTFEQCLTIIGQKFNYKPKEIYNKIKRVPMQEQFITILAQKGYTLQELVDDILWALNQAKERGNLNAVGGFLKLLLEAFDIPQKQHLEKEDTSILINIDLIKEDLEKMEDDELYDEAIKRGLLPTKN